MRHFGYPVKGLKNRYNFASDVKGAEKDGHKKFVEL
jgi:hypothetical protein